MTRSRNKRRCANRLSQERLSHALTARAFARVACAAARARLGGAAARVPPPPCAGTARQGTALQAPEGTALQEPEAAAQRHDDRLAEGEQCAPRGRERGAFKCKPTRRPCLGAGNPRYGQYRLRPVGRTLACGVLDFSGA